MSKLSLENLGWSDFYQKNYDEIKSKYDPNIIPARVSIEYLSSYKLYSEQGELSGMLAGKFHYQSQGHKDFPVVGDWVLVKPVLNEEKAIIQHILPRKTKFSRKEAGQKTDEQIIAANIDLIFLMSSMNIEFNPNRIQRYLALIFESGAEPVILLNKSDLAEDKNYFVGKVKEINSDIPVYCISSIYHEGIEDLKKYFSENTTSAVIGSSGVGKSTFINELLGENYSATQEISLYKDRGIHTTAHRELIILPSGGLIIDTPGMREVQLWEAGEGISEVYSDLEELSLECKFSDCKHESEPGCAIQKAIEEGIITEERLKSFKKLERELNRLEMNRNKREKSIEKRKFKQISKSIRKHYKDKKER
jgi:ribosome biogenesis GTPase / thiamine phosphate phosphatase